MPVIEGHVAYLDAPWAMVSISQAQFWPAPFARTWGDGQVQDCLSVVISNWDEPGILFGKPAKHCTPEEVAREVWAQMKAHLEDTGRQVLDDSLIHTWALDEAITDAGGGVLSNDDPYLLNTVGSWDHRPDAATGVPNLFLAGDYVRTYSNVDFTSMETANEAGRRAANALLEAADSNTSRVPLFEGYEAPEYAAAKLVDRERYRMGLPHILDIGTEALL
ncbi:FAD-dependent oxidoreductase [Streptomyces sp. NPDC002896]|uniref:FAD-dependent oxidoreductase n=1 Tax=Streptomyces sp. NPDC002896 TaxID=3154438 RepID=UPI0033199A3E